MDNAVTEFFGTEGSQRITQRRSGEEVLIPVCSVVRITKERTAKIFPNAVGVCTRTEKHVFASLISRDTTFKLMCKVWNYSIEQEAEEIRALQRRVAAQGGYGRKEMSIYSPADVAQFPENFCTTLRGDGTLGGIAGSHLTASPQQVSGRFSVVRKLGSNVGGRGPSLLLVATALLVILFMSAALLLSRISSLQQKLMERPVIHDSEQFYQELLSWQTKLHSTTGEEIHQYINSNLQQIVKVRESLEALSMLFVNRPQGAPGLGEPHPSTIMGGEGDHHHHHHQDS
ncbi:putative membrane protein C20F10.07 [Orchesella cincta]|uniref:Putative membrane protein C20F10.07 n=1 Tax=Orchesella cincta TaxID=48709 RepID=A0A1D2NHC2_ORCCI|nr:putative membrane protein C20F10.07 [Orchesella cincta]